MCLYVQYEWHLREITFAVNLTIGRVNSNAKAISRFIVMESERLSKNTPI